MLLLKRFSTPIHVVGQSRRCLSVAVLWLNCSLAVPAQEVSDRVLPANWRDLATPELITELKRLSELVPRTVDALAPGLEARATELLQGGNLPEGVAARFARYVSGKLSPAERAALISQVKAGDRPVAERTFGQLRSQYAALVALDASAGERADLVKGWLAARNLASLSPEELGWTASRVFVPPFYSDAFSVRWRGFVTAEKSGEYTFSWSPIRPGFLQSDFRHARQSLSVRVAGRRVLTSSSEHWNPQGAPVSLQAGQPAAVDIMLSYENVGVSRSAYPPVALLYWEVPGVSRELVPESVLTPAEGSGSGLSADYRATVDGQPIRHRVRDNQVAYVWPTGRTLAAERTSDVQQLVDELWERCTDADYLQQCAQDPALSASHPLLADPDLILEVLTPSQRQTWLQTVHRQPALVNGLAVEQMVGLYGALRFAGPDQALDLLGHWMSDNSRVDSVFSFADYAGENRHIYRQLADMVSWQYPPHAQRLHDLYLVRPDGGCSLGAAYTLAFVHIVRDDFRSWLELLDSRLATGSLICDQRVDWLMARGMAEEVKYTGTDRYQETSVFPAKSESWLREALPATETSAARLRVYRELTIRAVAARDFVHADKIADEAARKMPQAAPETVQWKAEIDQQRAALQLDQELQAVWRQNQLQDAWQERLDVARQHGDQRSIELYEQLLQQPIPVIP